MNYEHEVARAIIEACELEGMQAETFPMDRLLFASTVTDGFGFDSLTSLTIISELSDRFDLPFDDVLRDDMRCASTLVDYIKRKKEPA